MSEILSAEDQEAITARKTHTGTLGQASRSESQNAAGADQRGWNSRKGKAHDRKARISGNASWSRRDRPRNTQGSGSRCAGSRSRNGSYGFVRRLAASPKRRELHSRVLQGAALHSWRPDRGRNYHGHARWRHCHLIRFGTHRPMVLDWFPTRSSRVGFHLLALDVRTE